ncbi:MAG: hypothetical protein LBF44_02725 [Holosporaceae bacterium]|nr:hypothetical protein [Holosporaceae bacterium]
MKQVTCSKIKWGILFATIVSFALGFLLSRFTTSSKTVANTKLNSDALTEMHKCVKELLETHRLLKNCTPNSRALDFLRKGGEYFADYKNPRTLNDKIGYIYDNYFQKSPVTSHIGNKYFAKKYIAQAVGENHVAKLLGIWDNPKDIEWNILPRRFVLKAVRGHYGKQVILVKDKNKIDIAATVQKLEEFCKTSGMHRITGKHVLAEEYFESSDGTGGVTDYKFFCSRGKALFAYCLAIDDSDICDMDEKSFSFYSVPEWKRLPIVCLNHQQNLIPPPRHLTKMIELAEKLSRPFPLIRVDFYEIGDRVIVGELTEDSGGAQYVLSPVIWDFKLGEMFDVPTLEELEKIIEADKKVWKYENL